MLNFRKNKGQSLGNKNNVPYRAYWVYPVHNHKMGGKLDFKIMVD